MEENEGRWRVAIRFFGDGHSDALKTVCSLLYITARRSFALANSLPLLRSMARFVAVRS